jgi:hypothetical protein
MFIDDLSLFERLHGPTGGPAKRQGEGSVPGHQTAATDTKPRDGMESATTTDISNSSESHGNECHDVAALVAGRCLHGAKNNRIREQC